jgi:hypothetical protein
MARPENYGIARGGETAVAAPATPKPRGGVLWLGTKEKGRRLRGAPILCPVGTAYQLAPSETPNTRGSSENTLVYSAEVGSVR